MKQGICFVLSVWTFLNGPICVNATGALPPTVLRPARVFDGASAEPHEGWVVVVRGERIEAVGVASDVKVPEGARVVNLPGTTLLPGLIDVHTHVLLHPYNECSGTIKCSRSRWRYEFAGRPIISRVTCFPGLPPFGT